MSDGYAPAGQFAPLTPEQEQSAVDAVVALDWTPDQGAGTRAVAQALAFAEERAELVLRDLAVREILRQKTVANNIAETGEVQNRPPWRWERAGSPTRLEIIRFLTGLGEVFSLDESRQALCGFFSNAIDEKHADTILQDLRDRGLLTMTKSGMRYRWMRAGANS